MLNRLTLEADNLACVRGGRTVFAQVGLSLASGAALTLEGPNGAGKTSLLRLIAGFLTPAAGTISIRTNEGEIAGREERGRLCAWLGHQDGVKPQFTVAENARFWSSLYGTRADTRETLARTGLAPAADLPAQYLSAGQKRRLALARLLLCARPVWLLDEPLASLDASGRALVSDLIRGHCAGGGIAIVATHEPLGIGGERLALA